MQRNLDEEKIVDKMRSLRDKRDLEILNQELEGINLNCDYQKKIEDNKVLDVRYLGIIDFENKDTNIYLLLEQKEDKDGKIEEIERYYTEDGIFLGGNNKSDQYNCILLNEKYTNEKEILEQLQKLDKEGILDLNNIETSRLEEIAQTLGTKVERLQKISEINPDEKILKEDKEEIKEHKEKKDDKEELTKKQVDQISSKTEIFVNQKVTDRDTISSLLNVQDKGYKKIAIIYSHEMKNPKNTTKFSFVGIKEDGSAEKIDTLEQAYGNAPTKEVNTVNRDGSKIEQKQMNSIYRIKGKSESQLAIDIGPMGTIEPTYVRTPAQDNGEAISIPIETYNIRPTTRQTRELMNESRNPRVKEEIEKIEQHRELGCEDINIKDIDDNPYNNTHEHIEINDGYLDKCVVEILKNDKIASVYSRDDVRNRLINAYNNGQGNKDEEQLINEVENKMEKEADEEYDDMNTRR